MPWHGNFHKIKSQILTLTSCLRPLFEGGLVRGKTMGRRGGCIFWRVMSWDMNYAVRCARCNSGSYVSETWERKLSVHFTSPFQRWWVHIVSTQVSGGKKELLFNSWDFQTIGWNWGRGTPFMMTAMRHEIERDLLKSWEAAWTCTQGEKD